MRRFVLVLVLVATFSIARELQAPRERPVRHPPKAIAMVARGPLVGTTDYESVRVSRAIDGDTIALENGERVRYVGIDTPETKDPRKPVQCFGKRASARNKELVEGKTVRLVRDVSDRDRYGRLLRYVYVGDTFVNLALVEEGFAKSYSYPPDISKQEQFRSAERAAREAKRGLWGECHAGR